MTLLVNRVHQNAIDYPNEIALTLNEKHISYHQLDQLIQQATHKCISLGLHANDKVALVLPNIIETVVLFYALNALGITLVMCHPLSSGKNLKDRCELLGCKAVFILDILEKRLDGYLDQFKKVTISASHSSTGIIALGLKLKSNLFSSRKILWDKVTPANRSFVNHIPKEAVVLFSSGTSGFQKGISLSNDAINSLVDQMIDVIEPQRGIDSMFCILPFFHGFGLAIALHTVLALGGRCILVPRLHKETLIKTLLKEKPTYIAAVPYLLKVLLKDERFINADLSFIKQVFVGGESVPLSLIEKFNTVLKRQGSKAVVQVGYGCTETVTAVTLMDRKDSGRAGVGKPFKGNTIKILKNDNTFANANTIGEILISGPTLMNGYVGMEELTKDVLIKIDHIDYYKTGDIGYLDTEGILHFKHRKDQLIKIKGYIINPDEIIEKIIKIKAVEDAKVLVNDNDQLIAVLVLNDLTKKHIIQKEIIQSLKDLDDWSIPKKYYIIESIPMNEMRKSDLKALEEGIRNQSLEFLLEWTL